MPTADLEQAPVTITAEEIEAQLSRILDSHHFRHSHRYPALLRYLVEQTQAAKGSLLKERLVGIEVFHRAPNYDTNADPVVRVTAAEVRKRIAQYYQEPEHLEELRIDLPTGSYVPRFARSQVMSSRAVADVEPEPVIPPLSEVVVPEPASALSVVEQPAKATTIARRRAWMRWIRMRWVVLGAVLCLGVLLALVAMDWSAGVMSWRDRAVRRFWAPMSAEDAPILVVIGDHTVGTRGNALRSAQDPSISPSEAVLQLMNEHEQVTLTDVMSLFRLTDYMVRQNLPYRVSGPAGVDVAELRNGPLVLFAGLNNRWSMRLAQHLRFRFEDNADDTVGIIEDAQTPGRTWQVDFKVPYSKLPMDYALVARYFDPLIEQPVLLVAGVGSNGTTAASEFVRSERMIEDLEKLAPKDGKHSNVEVVLAVPVVDGHAGAPHIVASQFW